MTPNIQRFVMFVEERFPIVGPGLLDGSITVINERFDKDRRNIFRCPRVTRHVLEMDTCRSKTKAKTLETLPNQMCTRESEGGDLIG